MFDRPYEKDFAEYLDELYPLEGINCNAFSVLLKRGDPIAYELAFKEYASSFPTEGEA